MKLAALLCITAFSCTAALAAPYEGRVEVIEQAPEPHFPEEMLREPTPVQSLPDRLLGKWYGDVEVAQFVVYEKTHATHPYWSQFVREIREMCSVGQRGQLVLEFKRQKNGTVMMNSSNVNLGRRLVLRFVPGKGNAVVPGGFHIQSTIANSARVAGDTIDQSRIDKVDIVNAEGKLIQRGHSEFSAQYTLTSPKRMSLKLIEVDYDDANKPLWKILLRGKASR